MIKTNYHTHHELCNHAVGTTEDYVRHAIRHGFEELGMSDHVYNDRLQDTFRMREKEFPLYLSDVRQMQEKYHHQIKLHLGLECEYLEKDHSYYERLLDEVDYLILGHHYVKDSKGELISSFALSQPEQVISYANEICEGIKTGYFSMVAHPDLFMCGYDTFDAACEKASHMIIKTAIDHHVPLEFNANGIRRGIKKTSQGKRYPYPRQEFWEIVAEYQPKVILSSDAHAPELLTDSTMTLALDILKNLDINLEQKLDFKKKP